MEFILFSYLTHLACGEQTRSYSRLLIFLLTFSCITSPEEPLWLFAVMKGAQNDIYRWVFISVSLYLCSLDTCGLGSVDIIAGVQ